jgi:RNA polymerase sigma factor (sigma-70 family)
MSLEVFYEENKNKLVHKLTGYSGDNEAAKDAVQNAFLRALENYSTLSLLPEKALWSWLYTTAKNALTDEKRKTSRIVPYDAYDEADPADDPTDAIMVKQLLHNLPENMIHVVSLRYFGGLNATEIGKLKGIPSATVRSQLRAAISILKKIYLAGGK